MPLFVKQLVVGYCVIYSLKYGAHPNGPIVQEYIFKNHAKSKFYFKSTLTLNYSLNLRLLN